ncbi:MAG: sulfite exporter TauE/SafE family protein [Pseudomonadota bacterium]
MSWPIALLIVATTAATSFLSGIFGMAGGMILMGVLIAIVPVAMAMVTHGVIMSIANGWRAWLLRDAIDWRVFWRYMIGAVIGAAVLLLVTWRPLKSDVYLILGLVPLVIWIPKHWFHLNIRKPVQAEIAGFIVQGMNTLAGVAGPLLDIFFVEAGMNRQQVVATKSATQVVSHLVKISYWSAPLILAGQAAGDAVTDPIWPPLWLFALAIPVSMTATWGGRAVLNRMKDAEFQKWVKWLITVIGAVYIWRALA